TCPAEPILRQSLNPFKYFLRQYFIQNTENTEETNKVNFKEVLQGLFNSLERSGTLEATTLAAELKRTQSMLGALVDLHWADSLYEQLEPELRFRNTLIAFKTLIQAESLRQPVILHVEDANWLDDDSQELLGTLTHNADDYPFVVLLSGRYRDDGSPFRIPTPSGIPEHIIDLDTLSSEGIRMLVAQMLDAEISPTLAAFIAEKTEGNPLFAEQLALDLRERELIQQRDGVWTIVSREVDTIPATINAVLIARLDRLAAQVKAVVQTAAVLGREFEIQILSRMLRDDVDLPYKMQRAEEELIWQAMSVMHYIFRHTMMRDAAYDMQLQARLRDLHALAADVMAQVYAAELEPHYADLAYHYGKAEDARQEFRYAKLAGEYAASRYANQEAIEHYHQALQSLSRLDSDESVAQRQDVYTALAEIQITIGQYDQAHEHLENALALSVRSEDGKGQVHVCRWMAQMHELRGEYDEALGWVQKGLRILNNQRTSDAAELRLIAGLIHTRRGNYDEATAQFQDALHIARYLDEAAARARAHNGLGVIRLRDDFAAAIDHFQQAFMLYEHAGDISGQAKSH
ncbi:MAG TPA: tetratricopeptide repeat protein, partial [Anaerolineales bacterium]|nr:tetratricopeptide repeat protein [Anaerolineales bacterium]